MVECCAYNSLNNRTLSYNTNFNYKEINNTLTEKSKATENTKMHRNHTTLKKRVHLLCFYNIIF
jgi:hypothetical protein